MDIIIRQATIHDLDELADIFNLYRVFYYQQSDKAGAREFLFQRFEHRESIVLVAVETGSKMIAGFTQLYPLFSSVSMQRVWVLNDLFVREEHRNMGIGKQLLDMAKDFAVATKAKGLQLETAPDNTGAQQLYERYGFQKDDEFFHYFLKV